MTQLSELFSLSHSTSPVIYKTATYSYVRKYYRLVNQAADKPLYLGKPNDDDLIKSYTMMEVKGKR